MNAHLLGREVRTTARFWALLALGLVLFAALMAAMYPSVRASYRLMTQSVPSFLRPMIESRSGFSTFEGFVTLAFNHPLVLAMLGGWAISRGAEAVAGEIERGTLGWMLSYPLSRTSWILTKAGVLLVGTALHVGVFIGAMWVTLGIAGIPHAGVGPYARVALMTFLLYGGFGMIALWASAARSDRGAPALWATGVMLAALVWDYAAQSWTPLKAWRWLSLYAYYEPRTLLYGSGLDPRHLAVLGGVLVLGLMAALWTFRRRDLSI